MNDSIQMIEAVDFVGGATAGFYIDSNAASISQKI